MGYYSINRGEIRRDYKSRKIIASVYDDETQQTYSETFEFAEIKLALKWIEERMCQLSM